MNKQVLHEKVMEAESIVYAALPEKEEHIERITEAMEYTVKAGGKRVRPILMLESYRLFADGRKESRLLYKFMAALEFIHSYSLCHDDLPAMDNDTLRRGKPSTWAMYDEAFGVLAGDALLNYAFETVSEELEKTEDAEELRRGVKALNVLAKKAGIHGMIGGQCLDVYSEKTEGYELRLNEVIFIHKTKTAALLESALMCGAILAGAAGDQVKIMEEAALNVGLAFQIRDDILDVISTSEKLGKPIGSDEENNKVTYVTIKGVEEAQKDVEKYSEKAVDLLNTLPVKNAFLNDLIMSMVGREA